MPGGPESAGRARPWSAAIAPARSWLGANLTPGQRWTAGLILAVTVAMLAFGSPRSPSLLAASDGSLPPAATPSPDRNRITAFPASPATSAPGPTAPVDRLAGFETPASAVTAPPGTAASPGAPSGPPAATPPTTSPPPGATPAPGPCQLDTGLPVPVARTLVGVLATTETTLGAATGQPPPVDFAALLGSLAGCPPPAKTS